MLKPLPLVLINCTTLMKGGGLQCAVSFVAGIRKYLPAAEQERFRFALSRPVADELGKSGFLPAGAEVFQVSPARIVRGRSVRKRLLVLAEGAGLVFTLFGPSYVRFPIPELMGFADPSVIYPRNAASVQLRGRMLVRSKLLVAWKSHWLKNCRAYVVETKSAAGSLGNLAPCRGKPVFVVSNAVPHGFGHVAESGKPVDRPWRVLAMAAPYPHKNIGIIPKVCAALAGRGRRDFEFLCTLSATDYDRIIRPQAERLGVSAMIRNLGIVPVKLLTETYTAADIVLHPSLVEVFSATFLEAMKANRPVVASHLPHAVDICDDAAVYFDHRNPADCAAKLCAVADDPALRSSLVARGASRFNQFPDDQGKFALQMNVLQEFAQLIDPPPPREGHS